MICLTLISHQFSPMTPPPPCPSSGSAADAPASPDMSELTLTVSEVQSVLEAVEVTKATRPDNKIPAKLLKETASIIAASLCKLFSKSLRTGPFPQNWKEANNVPVFKRVTSSAQRITGPSLYRHWYPKSWSDVYLTLQR